MPASYNSVSERRPNLGLAFEELLTAIVRLRSGRQTVSDVEAFRAQVRTAVRSATQEGIGRGYAPEDAGTAAYAVVAFLDESILNLRSPIFATWAGEPLQQEFSNQHLAGDLFFDYLQRLMARRDSVELADILEIFYLCVLLGYRGRYGVAGGAELSAIMRGVQDKIVRSRGGTTLLSPLAQLPRDLPEPKAPDKWLKRLTWTVAFSAAASLVVFVICKLVLVNGAAQLQSLAGH